MPRTPIAATARLDRITIRFTGAERKQIDKLRGPLTTAGYIRHLIRADVQARRTDTIVPED